MPYKNTLMNYKGYVDYSILPKRTKGRKLYENNKKYEYSRNQGDTG